IHAFVTPADQQQFIELRVFSRARLVEPRALGRQEHYLRWDGPLRPNTLHSFKDRSSLQQHAFATAERPVIHSLMPIVGPRAQIMHPDFDHPALARPADHAVLERSPEKLRKNRDDVEDHNALLQIEPPYSRSNNPGGNSTRMILAATSISFEIDR